MYTNTIIGVVVAILVILGLGYFFFTSSNGTTLTGNPSGSTFADIIAAGANVQCEFTHTPTEGDTTSGRMYIADSGQKIRGSFTVAGETTMQAEMLRDGDYNYMWGSSMPQGVKMRVTEENRNTPFESNGTSSVPDDVVYTCTPWTVNESTFALPSGIEFMDMSAQMQNFPTSLPSGSPTGGTPSVTGSGSANVGGSAGGSADLKAMQCAACNQAPDAESRTQCLQALSCAY